MSDPRFMGLRAAAALGASLLLGGCFLFGQWNQINEQDLQFRNDAMRVNVNTVGLALKMWARDHHSNYPPKATWLQELSRSYYLPNTRLPPNPWSILDEHTQANVPGLGGLPPVTEQGIQPEAQGFVLGKGSRPSSTVYTTTTYGALLYDVTENRRVCVLYGVGQQGDNAVVVAVHQRGVR